MGGVSKKRSISGFVKDSARRLRNVTGSSSGRFDQGDDINKTGTHEHQLQMTDAQSENSKNPEIGTSGNYETAVSALIKSANTAAAAVKTPIADKYASKSVYSGTNGTEFDFESGDATKQQTTRRYSRLASFYNKGTNALSGKSAPKSTINFSSSSPSTSDNSAVNIPIPPKQIHDAAIVSEATVESLVTAKLQENRFEEEGIADDEKTSSEVEAETGEDILQSGKLISLQSDSDTPCSKSPTQSRYFRFKSNENINRIAESLAVTPKVIAYPATLPSQRIISSSSSGSQEDESLMETTRKYKRLRAWSIVLAIVLCGSVIGHCIHIYFTDQSTAYSRKLRLPDITPNSTHMNFSQHPDILAVMNDTQLHKVFYGITYTPDNAQYPDCQVSMKAVTRDIALLSQLTSRIRLYGTDCNQVDHVLMAIQDLGVDMTISIGLWIDRKLEVSLRQFIDLQEILSRYPHKLIDSIYVGNEVLFREDATVMELTGYIRYVKEYLKRNHIVKPVATSEIGSKWNPALAKEVDIVSANIHPFFGGIDVEHSTIWTFDFLVDYIARNINATSETKFIISEIGWPTEGEPLKRARPGVRELQRFLDSWVCLNQGDEVGWYWFEAFDEPWKAKSWDESTKWEPHWGLFTPDRRLKNIRIPSCI